ncbi:MAG: ferrichrome ABC transporter permease [Bacillaceae bacterium G1]|nr:MAG: ferrichrome ABC transporter permease [Bacillaceae bacterium G1]
MEISNQKVKVNSRPVTATIVLAAGLLAVALSIGWAVSVGAADIQLRTVWEAIFCFNPDLTQHQIIHELRLPRVLAAALVGACFAVAGALMQGMTRNPLADSGLLGLNAGAAFALALCFAFFPGLPYPYIILYSFVGAAVGAGLVYGIGSLSRQRLTPIRLTLAGAAVSALLVALSEGIAIYYRVGQDMAFWYAGGVAGVTWSQLKWMAPLVAGALTGSLLISRSITLLSLGDEVATGLGERTGRVKTLAILNVLALAGAAVSVAGPISFIGLMVPHIARFLVGVDYRWIIPSSAVLGSLLMVLADMGGRILNPPYETPVGTIIALLGVPFFLYLARQERRNL